MNTAISPPGIPNAVLGIDASRSTARQRTGTETYSLQLIRALLQLPSYHHWRLYFRDAPPPNVFPAAPHIEQRIIPFPRLWTHMRLGAELSLRPPAGLFVPAHARPLLCPVPTVVTVHDLGYLHFPGMHPRGQRDYLHWSTRHSARHATQLIADSEATRNDLIDHYNTDPTLINVIYPGFDPAPFAAAPDVPAHPNLPETYLLHVGTLHPRKGLTFLLEAMAALRDHPARPMLVCAGRRGWMYAPILRQVEELRLEKRIRFLDYVPHEQLPALYRQASMLLLPSLYEGFGFTPLESMAAGTPVICSRSGSLPEVVGDAALTVPAGDAAALAAAIRRILEESGLRHKLIARGLHRCRQFPLQRSAEKTLAVLEHAFKL
ncbi:MAG: glycosyltransferase family 1 protein [Anaerolineales bacterium]|nr:glycosyltransferase family 1 protein [Anaerolineales bacterium]